MLQMISKNVKEGCRSNKFTPILKGFYKATSHHVLATFGYEPRGKDIRIEVFSQLNQCYQKTDIKIVVFSPIF